MSISICTIAVFIIAAYNGSVTQSDWSIGAGILGPVINWEGGFFSCSDIDPYQSPGNLMLSEETTVHSVGGVVDGAYSVCLDDINGDGYLDVICATRDGGEVIWWENTDGSGVNWNETVISTAFSSPRCVYASDLDNDDDVDIVVGSFTPPSIAWLENADGTGTAWNLHVIDSRSLGAMSVCVTDIDGDGDLDVEGAMWYPNPSDFSWWENTDGLGTAWTEHIIDTSSDGARGVYSQDIDSDGDMDVVGAVWKDGEIHWWENSDGSGTDWDDHLVSNDAYQARDVYVDDIDGDGDYDILGALYWDDEIVWWANSNGTGDSWNRNVIGTDFNGAWAVCSEDIDGDGDVDVLGAALQLDRISWWENIDGLGASWSCHLITGGFNSASAVATGDIDTDSDIDVLGCARYADAVNWWNLEHVFTDGVLESTILYLGSDPEWEYIEWGAVEPPNTSVAFQVRASDDYKNMGVWSDTLLAPSSLDEILPSNASYLQYKVILMTESPEVTPTLSYVEFSYNPVAIEHSVHTIHANTPQFSIIPNPAISQPVVRFELHHPSSVALLVFDVSGHLVTEIPTQTYHAGYHDVPINELAPGVYFCRMDAEGYTGLQRFVVLD